MTISTKSYQTIVLGAGPNGLGAVRGLAIADIRICLIGYSRHEPSLLSRFPVIKFFLPEGTNNEKENRLYELLDCANHEAVVIPTSDWFVAKLAAYKIRHPDRFLVCMPNQEIADVIIDKAKETKLVAEVAPLPKTVQELPADPEQLMRQLRLPIIFKPRSFEHQKLGQKTIQVKTREDLAAFYIKFNDGLASTIAQEIVPGEDSCLWVCNCTFNGNSELVDAFTFRRLKLSPAHYGVTSYAISEMNEQVIAEVKKIGSHLRYTGPAMFEFKYDARDNDFKYIELNPRLGMCNYFDTRCGVNNVLNTYLLARGTELSVKTPAQRSGVIFVSLYEDMYARKKDGQSLMSILRDYARDMFKPHVFIYFSSNDPWPFFVQLWRNIKSIVKTRTRKSAQVP